VVSTLHRCSPHHARTARPLETARAKPAEERPGAAEVAALAYRYWQARGCPIGSPEEDWYRAERFLAANGRTFPAEEL